jgi:hypothetical protein
MAMGYQIDQEMGTDEIETKAQTETEVRSRRNVVEISEVWVVINNGRRNRASTGYR